MNGKYVRGGWLALAIGGFVIGDGSPLAAAEKSWNAGSDSWSTPANWTPAGVPGLGDVVRIGNLPGVTSSTVFLDVNRTLGGLHISNHMALQNEGHTIIVNGETTVSGDASRLNIEDAVVGYDFQTDDMTISADANVYLSGGIVRINDQLTLAGGQIGGLFNHANSIGLWGTGTTVRNGGVITSGPGSVTFLQNNNGLYDLDGPNGDGELFVSGTSEAALVFLGGEISDPFSGKITLGPYARLAMNFGAWTADANSFIDVYGGFATPSGEGRAEIMGGTATFAGAVDVSGADAKLLVSAPAVVAPTATVNVGLGDRLVFSGVTRVEGGTFGTNGLDAAAGQVNFDGATEWSGTVTIDGRAQQNGAATVTAPTVINAGLFDWDGAAGGVVWDVEAPLVVNAVTTTSGLSDPFGGVMNIGGGALPRVTLNLAGGSQVAWWMQGELNLSGHNTLFMRRLDGATMLARGEINVEERVEIGADVIFMPEGVVAFVTDEARLRMRGQTSVREEAEFNGAGTLVNGIGGEMRLFHEASLGDAGLENHGRLEFRRYGAVDSAALAAVDRFANDGDGTFAVRIGGDALGDEFDHLLVTGGAAMLDGLLEVLLFDANGAPFTPQVGDLFPIITALGGVTGTFDNAPTSHRDGVTYQWAVDYLPHQAVLRLESIAVPEPTGALLASLAAGMLLGRRRLRVAIAAADVACVA